MVIFSEKSAESLQMLLFDDGETIPDAIPLIPVGLPLKM